MNINSVKYILEYLNQYSSGKKLKISMIQRYPYSTRWEENIFEALHIYGARAVLMVFCDHQDNESKSR